MRSPPSGRRHWPRPTGSSGSSGSTAADTTAPTVTDDVRLSAREAAERHLRALVGPVMELLSDGGETPKKGTVQLPGLVGIAPGIGVIIIAPVKALLQPTLTARELAAATVTLHRLVVDFDRQKEWVKHFKAPRQSTLLVYKGTDQQWFAVAENRYELDKQVIESALSNLNTLATQARW